MFLNVCKQTFHISHMRIFSTYIIFIWRRRYWQIFKSALRLYKVQHNQSNFRNLFCKCCSFLFLIFFVFWCNFNCTMSCPSSIHCVRSDLIRSFSCPYFPLFGLNTGKYGPEKTPYLDTFHAVMLCCYPEPKWQFK